MNEFFVELKLHNGANGGWAFSTPLHTGDYSKAKKEFHKQMQTYIGIQDFDFVCCAVVNRENEVLIRDVWEKPEPIPEVPEEDTEE